MRTRYMAGAFLACGDKVLLIRRGMHKALAPGLWSCVGGHVEPGEMNDPDAACYREIEEETGIGRELIEGLALRYMTVRMVGSEEIRTGYYYVGRVAREVELPACGEGELKWVPLVEVRNLGLTMTYSVGEITRKWLEDGEDWDGRVRLLAIGPENVGEWKGM